MGELKRKIYSEIPKREAITGFHDDDISDPHPVQFDIKAEGKTFLLYDFGLYVEHAARLARDGNKVKYFVESSTAFPVFSNYAPGKGIPGIEKVDEFFEHVDGADVIMFPDVDSGDMCDFLKGSGYTVYGGGDAGDDMENDRFAMKQLQFDLGLPTQKVIMVKGIEMVKKYLREGLSSGEYEQVKGQTDLDKFLKQKGNVFVKLNKYRGDMETFYAKDYESVSTILDYIDVSFGPFKDIYDFVIEECKEGVEVGFDCFFNGKEFLKPYLWGYEKHSAYIGVYSEEIPAPMKRVMNILAPYLEKINYKGAFSVEMMIDKDNQPYLIDITSRFPNPLSLIYTESIMNYSDVIYNIALGNSVRLEIKDKYVGCIPLKSNYALDHYIQVDIPPEIKDDVKLSMGCQYKGKYFGVKGMEVVATPIACEKTIDEVVSKLNELVPQVCAHQLQKGNMGDIYDITETIETGEKLGLKFN